MQPSLERIDVTPSGHQTHGMVGRLGFDAELARTRLLAGMDEVLYKVWTRNSAPLNGVI